MRRRPTHHCTAIALICVAWRIVTGVDTSFITGLFFPFLLIISATLYAFKTRKCPGGFNETRFILFTNCINTIHWLAFVPLYMVCNNPKIIETILTLVPPQVSTDHKIRAVILAYSLSLSGIVQLGCLIFPKLYTVLFKVTTSAVLTLYL